MKYLVTVLLLGVLTAACASSNADSATETPTAPTESTPTTTTASPTTTATSTTEPTTTTTTTTAPTVPTADPLDPATWDIEEDRAQMIRAFTAARGQFLADVSPAASEAVTLPPVDGGKFASCLSVSAPVFPDVLLGSDELIPDAEWLHPITGQRFGDDGWRVYLATSTVSYLDGQFTTVDVVGPDSGHVAVNDDGAAAFFPNCGEWS